MASFHRHITPAFVLVRYCGIRVLRPLAAGLCCIDLSNDPVSLPGPVAQAIPALLQWAPERQREASLSPQMP